MASHAPLHSTVRRPSPDRLEIREGGGCLSLFGLPFLAAGVVLLLAGLGAIPVRNGDGWAGPVMAAMGLAFVAVGGWLVLWRTRTTLDATRRQVTRARGLVVPRTFEERRLDGLAAVRLGFTAGGSDGSDTYPVTLSGPGSSPMVKLLDSPDWERSRRLAEEAAVLLGLPLEDASTGATTRTAAGQLGRPLGERLRAEELPPEPPRPLEARCRVERAGGALRVRIPDRELRWTMLLPAAFAAGVAGWFLPVLFQFFDQTRTPVGVQRAFGAFLAFLLVGLPLLETVRGVGAALWGHTLLELSRDGLRLTERHALRRRTTSIALADLLDLDVGRGPGSLPGPRRSADLPGRRLRSGGLVVKHRGGLLTVAAGLPVDEAEHVAGLLRRELQGLG
jgi:hypothetical protein